MTNTPAGMEHRSFTVRDVARLAGVSTATVSRVVNGTSEVSEETRTKVLNAIATLQFSPNEHAVGLGRANSGIPRHRAS
jgi:LacI family transcriptional regulator